MNYSPLTLDHFSRADRAGTLAGDDVARGAAGSIEQGTWVQFDLRVARGPDGPPTVLEARFLAFGDPCTIAVADWLAGRAAGQPLRPVLAEGVQALQHRFGVPVEKLGRLLVVEDAWIAAARAAGQRPATA